MSDIKRLKKLLEPKKIKKGEGEVPKEIDDKTLSKIVTRMKKKYRKEGISVTDYKAREADNQVFARSPKIMEGTTRELLLHKNPAIRFFAKIYHIFGSFSDSFNITLQKYLGKSLEKNLLASGMLFSLEQYLAIIMSMTLVIWLFSLMLMSSMVFLLKLSPFILILTSFLIPLMSFIVSLLIPSSRANRIANDIEKQLPFALRHMGIEIRAGVGIFNTMDSIAMANYGKLSEGFKYVLGNIQKGMPTEEALESWAYSTKSDSLQRVIGHLVRAIRTGGNLSDIMMTISQDISFERRMKISDFAEKLNLMSLFLMMIAIVLPVMIGILTAIGATPSLSAYVSVFSSFSLNFLRLIYFIIVPSFILIFIYFVKVSDPGV